MPGPRRLRRAAASDGGPLRVTTVTARGRWRQAAAGDGGPLRVTRAAAAEESDGLLAAASHGDSGRGE